MNLYPFEATVAKPDCTLDDAIENIDIGGPAMVRAAAKNHAAVAVIVDPADYARVLDEMRATTASVSADDALRARGEGVRAHRGATTARSPTTSSLARRAAATREFPRDADAAVRQAAGPALRREPAPERGVLPRRCDPRRARSPTRAAAGQGAVLQQHRRRRRGVGMRARVRRAGLRHRQARQSLRRRHRRRARAMPTRRRSRPIRSRRSAASSRSTARSTQRPPQAIVASSSWK